MYRYTALIQAALADVAIFGIASIFANELRGEGLLKALDIRRPAKHYARLVLTMETPDETAVTIKPVEHRCALFSIEKDGNVVETRI